MKSPHIETLLIAIVLFLSLAPVESAAGALFGVLGVGFGNVPKWGENSGGVFCAGSFAYRMGGPTVSARYMGAVKFDILGLYDESISEVAVLGGWDLVHPGTASAAVRLGVGKVSFRGGYAHAKSYDYEGHAWGPALQLEAFCKRIGLTFMANMGTRVQYHAVLMSIKLGNLNAE